MRRMFTSLSTVLLLAFMLLPLLGRIQAASGGGSGNRGAGILAQATWTATATPTPNLTVLWVDDSVPAAAFVTADGVDAWHWISANPAPDSGTLSHQSTIAAGLHQHYFYASPSTLTVGVGDSLIASVYLDAANPPTEIMLAWRDTTTSWEHRVYWGANNINLGTDGTASRYSEGALPATGQWVRLQVSASDVGLEGLTLDGMAYMQYDGRATWDRAGKKLPTPPTLTPTNTPTETLTPTITLTPSPIPVFIVTKLADTNDGSCDADCSLREAIAAAPVDSIIRFAGGLTGTIKVGSQLVITRGVTIDGPGPDVITLSGNNSTRILSISGVTVNIRNLTFTNGRAVASNGGAISTNHGALNIVNSVFRANAADASGGAIYANIGSLTIADSTFDSNTTPNSGGAMYVISNVTTITGSLFTNNNANTSGGAVQFYLGNPTTIANSTFIGNTNIAIYTQTTIAQIINSTIVGNQGGILGGTVKNTVVANNIGWNCSGAADGGHNLQYPGTDCGTSVLTASPILGVLQNNGGPTLTIALLPGSPAIDAGDNAVCAAAPLNNVDQRGVTRPIDGGTGLGSICDIGAYEAPAGTSVTPTMTPTTSPVPKTLVVTKLADTDDWACDADCSLREAIKLAANGDTITFAPGLTGIIDLGSQLTIRQNLTINGPGPYTVRDSHVLTIAIPYSAPGFYVQRTANLTIGGLNISGRGIYPGIGIYNDGAVLTMNGMHVGAIVSGQGVFSVGPTASTMISTSTFYDINGGSIYADGILTLSNSRIVNGSAGPGGGGLFVTGMATVTGSTFQNNRANNSGGAIFNSGGHLTVVNSTFQGNSSNYGGAIYTDNIGTVSTTIINSTISGNTASTIGGGIYIFGATSLANTILANNSGGNCAGNDPVDNGHNLQFPGLDCVATIPFGNPMLGPLQDNGGQTDTMALLTGSAAIDTGDNAICSAAPVNNLDQRGLPRPVDGGTNRGAVCDIGAFESLSGVPATPTPTVTPTATPTSTLYPGGTTIWVEDAIPAGGTPFAAGGDGWNWLSNNPSPDSGSLSHQSNFAYSLHEHWFEWATTTLPMYPGDTLIASVYLDPLYPPSEIMLHWQDTTTHQGDHRAYWGANLITQYGVDGTPSRHYMGALPPLGQWVRLQIPANVVAVEGLTLEGMGFSAYDGRVTWDRAGKVSGPPTLTPTMTSTTYPGATTIWVEDAIPAGGVPGIMGGDAWNWVSSNPAPDSGYLSQQSNPAAGVHQHWFYDATATLPINPGDMLIASVYLDPLNPPSEIMLQWQDTTGSFEHRAYWGPNLILWGTDGTPSRYPMGPLPRLGRWVRLQIPADAVGVNGLTLSGIGFTLYDGQANWDRAGKVFGPLPTPSPTGVPTVVTGQAPTPIRGSGPGGPSLSVQYVAEARDTQTASIRPQFRIVNLGSNPVPLSELRLRYYFTRDSARPLTFTCVVAQVGCGSLSATFVTVNPIQPGADAYLEVSFTAAAGSIEPGGSSGPVQIQVGKSDASLFNQSNDYSFDGSQAAFVDAPHVTLYRNGVLVWGVEPATPTSAPTYTATAIATATPTAKLAPTFVPKIDTLTPCPPGGCASR
jgi:CSLREA domain-containing protein